jgi:signal transduction histidine kinase
MTLRVIRDALGAGVPEDHRELVLRAEARAETLLDMVDDLLTLSRIREAPLQEAKTELRLGALIADVMADLADHATQKQIALRAEVQPELPALHAQADALRAMLMNLVGNAIKYTPAGGQVTVAARPDMDGRQVTLTVTDTGQGIAPEDCERLFEEFFRTESARQSGVHGTGLGLTICKLTVEAHEGTIAVESTVGAGTSFIVRLPVAAPPEVSPQKARPAE